MARVIGRSIDIVANAQADTYIVVGETESRMPSAAIRGSLEGRDYNHAPTA